MRLAAFAAVVLLAAPACALAASAPVDTFETRALADRAETVQAMHDSPTSPLAAILREDFGNKGAITIGSAKDNRVVLEGIEPHQLTVRVEGQGFRVEALDPAATFTVKDEPKREATVPPSMIGVGRYRVRLSYQNAPAVIVFDPPKAKAASFAGPTYYEYDARYRFEVPLVSETKADTVLIESTHSQPRPALRVGRFALKLPAREVKLAAYRLLEPGVSPDDLSLFFMDATNGKGSYHGGRFVDATKQPDGRWLIDLNNAYNPSCAYSPYYNCPIPPKENRLTVGIPAGESWSGE